MKPHELLTMLERAQVIKEAIARGIRSLDLIWAEYDQYVLMDNQQQYPLEQYEMLQQEPQQIPLELMPIEEIPEETPTPPQPIDLKELTRLRALEMFSNNTPLNFTTEKLNNSPELYNAPATPLLELLYTDTQQLTNLFDDGGNLKEEVYDAGTLPEVAVTYNTSAMEKANNSNARFIQRIKDPNRKHILNWSNKKLVATHKLSWATDDNGNAIVYPEIQEIDGKLHDFTDPKYNHGKWDSYDNALQNNNYVIMTPEEALWYTAEYKKYAPNFALGGNLFGDGGDENNPGEEAYWGNENFGYLPTTTVTAKAPTRWDEFSKDFRQFFTGKDKSNYVWDLNAGRYRYEKVADNPLDLFRYSEKRRARELRYLDRYNRLKEIIEENPLTYGVAEKPFWGLPYSTAESVYAGLQYLTGNKAAGDAIWDHINNEVAPQQIAPLAITVGTLGLGEGINAVAGPTATNIFNTAVLGLFGSLQAKDLEEKTNGFITTENLTPEDYVNTALMLGLPSAKYLEGMSGELILSLMLKGVNFIKLQPLLNAYIKAVQLGDIETALALRGQHFVEKAPSSVLIDNGNPMDLYHSTNNLFTVPNTTNNPKGSSSSFGPGFYTAPAENLAKSNNIMMRLYGNMKNPNIIWTADDWLKAANDFSFGDGVMARKTNRMPLPKTFTDIVFREPNQVKLADPVTYFKANDPEVLSGLFKAGDVIPLWMRDDFSRNDIRFTINPDGISLAPLSTDQISKGLSERQNFINWLQDNPEVSFIGGKGTSPDAAQNSWKKGAGWVDEVNINPNGRIGTYLLYLLNRFGLKPLKKIGLGSSNNFEDHVGGWYNPVTNQARVSVDNIEEFIPRVVHEIGGHSTEGEIMSKPLLDFTEKEPPKITGFNGMKDFLKSSPTEIFGREIKTIEDVYSKLANIKRSLTTLPKFYKNNKRFTMPLHSQDSRLAVEARATFKLLLELKLNEFGYDLQKYNEYIDNMTLEDIMSWLQEANGYGVDYRNNLKYASNKDKKLWLNLAKYALKYLPSIAPIAIGLSTASTDNQQALGGHLQNKQQTNLFLL